METFGVRENAIGVEGLSLSVLLRITIRQLSPVPLWTIENTS